MANFNIGLTGLDAAQKALDIIGNNIANSATEGYHRQRIDLTPAYSSQQDTTLLGGGVNVKGITRMIDSLLEKEILRQQSVLEQVSQEFGTLRTVENTLGELSTEDSGLNATIDRFFNSLQDLTAHPDETIWQNQVVSDAQAMAGEFRAIGEFLTALEARIGLEADNAIDSVNILTDQIAKLNDKIETIEMAGGQANNMRDQRDRSISDLSELIGIQTLAREHGVVDVSVGGIPLVIGSSATELEAGLNENGVMAISIAGALNYTTNVQGGKIGGLFSLKNELISDIHNNLDSLATAIIQQINQYHVQGVGSEGSFTSLTGRASASGDLTDISNVTAGSIFVRVTNTATGAITRTEITVDPNNAADNDSLSDIATDLSLITGLTASVNSSNQLTITAATGYKYDFLPAVLSAPVAADISFTGSSDPTVSASGIYTGSSNDTLTFTVAGTGNVGVDTLAVTVTDSASNIISTINIGSGYAAGEPIVIGSTGIKIALGTGDLVAGDSFSLDVFADTDTSGVLSAAGINTFFSGAGAEDMTVSADIIADPKRVATALGAEMVDNANAVRMANVRDAAVTALGGLTCGEYYRQLVTDTGQQLSLKQMRQDNLEVMLLNLANQQAETSGVDINDEAAQLLVFEQMFQAMAKYMNTINASVREIMDLL
ncbi:MAG: flagellar hook-associated protein FlgK [Planctomycetes bacterium]|nr:flagellar hook-associated protein FlgK [Planctomycetota bacterium]